MAKDDKVTFWMAKVDLPYFLEPHEFYVSEAKRRLLSQFSDIDREVKEKEEEYIEVTKEYFNPEYHDLGDVYAGAQDAGMAFAWSLIEMQKTVTLALVAGMYHQFDKMLRDKVIRHLRQWRDWGKIAPMIWKLNYPQLIDFLEYLGLNIRGQHYESKINACRLVVNVYKHGNGESNCELFKEYPEYYPNVSSRELRRNNYHPQHDDMEVTELQFTDFASAITNFWKSLPEYTYESQMRDEPIWFQNKLKALQKDAKKT